MGGENRNPSINVDILSEKITLLLFGIVFPNYQSSIPSQPWSAAEQSEKEMLALSRKARARLTHKLIVSLDEGCQGGCRGLLERGTRPARSVGRRRADQAFKSA